jgi:hypothetical protein
VVSRAHRLRRPDPNFLDRLHSGPRVEDNGKSGSKCDEQHGWKVTEAEPQHEQWSVGQAGDRIANADQWQEKILGPAIAADDDAETDSDQSSEKKGKQQPDHSMECVDRKDSVGSKANERGDDCFNGGKKFLREWPIKRKNLPGGRDDGERDGQFY